MSQLIDLHYRLTYSECPARHVCVDVENCIELDFLQLGLLLTPISALARAPTRRKGEVDITINDINETASSYTACSHSMHLWCPVS